MGLCFLCNINTIDPKHYYFFILITRIGVVAKPCDEFVAGVLAIWLNAGVAVPLALSYPEAELLHVMTDSDVSMILSTDDHRELMQKVAAKTTAQFSLIPNVPTMTSQAVDNGVVHQKENVFANNIKGINANHNNVMVWLVFFSDLVPGESNESRSALKIEGLTSKHQQYWCQG
ncbi:unnamed protein product [Lactuca saligna]|uniref:AMP-dependent synthetase/ligase domain-containing protein n=1 Tax=Lactuca saligna TaxID=75948 RepID=A0AA36EH65_LACSI|nr:unnamed protein product [Lactuca saligna]